MKKVFYPSSRIILNLLLIFFLVQGLPLLLKAQSYKIMPLGNSITHGTMEHPSYRDELYQRLKEAYIDFNYVGSKTSESLHPLAPRPSPLLCSWEPSPPPPFLAHEAHWGWRADELINGKPDSASEGKLADWLQGYTPDVVLMHVGTNDMLQNQSMSGTIEELREIVRILRQDNPKVIILIAKLFPVHAPVVGATAANNIDLLNSQIPTLVQELHTASSPVLLVDQNTGFDPTPGMDTYDGIHPRGGRVWQMARRWQDVLRTVLVSYTTPPAVEISAPEHNTVHKVGQAVSISAEAWDREEAVERVEFFANCEKIGEDSTSPYEISWTPTETESYRLTAEATDAAGARGGSHPVYIDVAEVVTGKIMREYWENVQATSVSGIPVTTAPTSVTELTSFEAPSNWSDNYGQRIRGYLTAPATGEYTFWIASDDYSELWLSNSADPGTKVKLAYVNGWTKPQEWGKYRSQQSVKMQLEVGKRYYIEALHLENGGGDNLAVGWQLPDSIMERPIPGHRLTPFEEGPPPPATTYSLAVSVVGLGSVTPANGTFLEDDIVTLKATPAEGYKFSGWSGDAVGANNPQPVAMHKNMNVTATFTRSEEPASLVSSVTSTTGKTYALTELAVGAKPYTDRTYQATSVPATMSGATLIQTPNDDKHSTEASILSFYLSKQATVYVAYDPRATVLPSWLSGWQKLTDRIGVNDSKISHMNLYSKSFPAGIVLLGGNLQSPAAGAQNNYFLVVKEAQAQYSLTVSASGSGTVTKTPDQTSYASGTSVSITATPAAGYHFTGWSGDTTATTTPLLLNMNGNIVITANFAPIEEPAGLVTNINSTTGKAYSLAVLEVGVKTYTDRTYQVIDIPDGLSGASIIQTPNDDKTNTSSSLLSFDLNKTATIYVAYDPRDTALPSWLSSWQRLSEKIEVNDPKISYMNLYSKSFAPGKITLGGNMESPAAGAKTNYFVIAQSKEAASYTISFSYTGEGWVNKSPNQASYALGTKVSLTAIAASGYIFNGWSGDTTGTENPLLVKMNSNKSIRANFTRVQHSSRIISNIYSVSGKSYAQADLIVGVRHYTDRTYQVTTVPSSLTGATLIQTPNDDKTNTKSPLLSFDLSRPATIYVAYDPRATALPSWLSGWQKITDRIGVNDSKISHMDLYAKSFPAGKVSLGGNMQSPAAGAQNNYFVIVLPDSVDLEAKLVKDNLNFINSKMYQRASISNMTNVNGTLFFRLMRYNDNSTTYYYSLWKSDGTEVGTVMVKDFGLNPIYPGSSSGKFTVLNGNVFFQASDPINGIELWKSDGTEAGTKMVKDISPGSGSSEPLNLMQMANAVYFTATDGIHGAELWKSDGTEAGTLLVKDIRQGSTGSLADFFAAAESVLYFRADDGIHGIELWKTDGTEAGTMMVKDIYPGSGYSRPDWMAAVGNTVYFMANDGIHGAEMWKTDGTVAGTMMVKDIHQSGSSSPLYLMAVSNTMYFRALDPINGIELWKTDGTEAGTKMVRNISPGPVSSNPYSFIPMGNSLYFQADDGTHGRELWKTDGTEAGTMMVKDIYPGSGHSSPDWMAAVGNTVYFMANDGVHGTEMWKTDGTVAGTVMVRDFTPGGSGSGNLFLAAVNENLYFVLDNHTATASLWKYKPLACSPPTVSFSASAACAGTALDFTDGSFGMAEDATYAWDMNDDGTVEYITKGDVSHTYATAGTYTARLTVTQGACSSSYTQTVTVYQGPCQQVVSVSLINASTKEVIYTVTDGTTINLATLPTQNLNFRVNTSPATVGSVEISLSGTQSNNVIENIAPYDLFGDKGAWTPAVGNYTLEATPYTASNGSGTAGLALTVSFSVINGTSSLQRVETAEIWQESVIPQPVIASYPNPFIDKTTIEFSFPEDEDYELEVYSPDGGLADKLGNGRALAGQPVQVAWKPALAASGVYIIRLATSNRVHYLRIVLNK